MHSLIVGGSKGAGVGLRPADARIHHRRIVLNSLIEFPRSSRADLARATRLSAVTVAGVVSELSNEGLIIEQPAQKRAGPGAPSRSLKVDASARNVLSVVISSGEYIDAALLDLNASPVATRRVPRGGARGDEAFAILRETAVQLLKDAKVPVLGVGVCASGIINESGVVLESSHLGWNDFPLRDALTEHVQCPVYVSNGVTAIGLAERANRPSTEDFILIRVGAGVGTATVINGSVVQGARNAAGEFGHVVVTPEGGPRCMCGKRGCLEAWIGVPALQDRLTQAGDSAAADSVLADAGQMLGASLAPVSSALGMTNIVLSGPPDLLGGTFAAGVKTALHKRLFSVLAEDIDVSLAANDDATRLRGIASIVLSEQCGIGLGPRGR